VNTVANFQPKCRFCDALLRFTFVDLGMSPLAESWITPSQLHHMEPFYPLHVYVCEHCFLVQLEEFESPDHIFSDYAYFSSYSESWLEHAKNYVEMAVKRFQLGPQSQVVEIASNDGYLLRNFVEKRIPSLGIEPAANIAKVAVERGIPTRVRFFGEQTARDLVSEGIRADLIIGNNVLAQVPALNDFVEGMKILLRPNGTITMEFPHLMQLMVNNQFDTIYHEHFSYLSFSAVERVFESHGLALYDVDEIPTHGGSLRIYAAHAAAGAPVSERARELKAREQASGFDQMETYLSFTEQVKETKRKLLEFLIHEKRNGKTIVAYGAAAKGVTLLNYCGVRTDFIDYAVDVSPHKQGHYMPGVHIPIYHPDKIKETRPDYVLILPWNLKDEIIRQMAEVGEWGGQFVVPIPELTVYPAPRAQRIAAHA
jgi:C-methyltransferase-like protein/putative zinc binding protein/methyltransferase family protein